MKVVTLLHDSVFTKNLHKATLQAYPKPHHFYNLHPKGVRTHSVIFMICLVLVVAKLSDATIKHILCWDPYAWKVYVCDSLYHVSQASIFSFYTALGTQTKNHDVA